MRWLVDVVGVGVVVVFCDNKATQARIGIWDLGFGILGFGLALAWVWQNHHFKKLKIFI